MSVFARLMDAGGKARGLTGFAVRQDDPGVVIGPESLTMGVRGIMQNSVRFDDVRLGGERLLGQPGAGMQIVEDVLSHGRLATGSVGVGIGMRALQIALRFAQQREVETGTLLENAQTRLHLGEMLNRLSVERALLEFCARDLDAGGAIVPEAAMAVKVASTGTGFACADLAMQLLGGRGVMETNIVPQLFRDARMLSIGEGANEGLTAALGRSLRFSGAIPAFLERLWPAGGLGERLLRFSATMDGLCGNRDSRVWADAGRGQLVIAAMTWAAARRMDRLEAEPWAESRFDDLEQRLTRGMPPLPDAQSLSERVAGFGRLIGDLEPLAPDVDWELDRLLRRQPAPSKAAAMTAQQKRELLRKMLSETGVTAK